MNNVLDLFKGIGVIIDDDLDPEKGKTTDSIWNIRKFFEDKNVPILSYYELPSDENIKNFNSISFLLLDWELSTLPIEEGVQRPDLSSDNIDFIKKFNKVCFAPIFIFSNDQPKTIISKLSQDGLYDGSKSNYIFVESKSELKDADTLLQKLKEWIEKTPSIYVLKEWELSLQQAKNSLFWDFYNINPNWTNVLRKAFLEDGTDENYELGDMIYKNIIARTISTEFDKKIINNNITDIPQKDLRKVLECERFLEKDKLSDIPSVGDLFREHYKDEKEQIRYKYYINIRPDCDYIRDAKKEKGRDIKLYCLKGRIVDENNINSGTDCNINFKDGCLEEKINQVFVPFIDEGKIIEFLLRDIEIKKWNDIKEKRIGRLLPPYIIRLQQKYAFYLQRQGLPRIPEEAIKQQQN